MLKLSSTNYKSHFERINYESLQLKLLSIFGAQVLSNPIGIPFERAGDNRIIEALFNKIPNNPRLKILELGGGVTYPLYQDISAPWLARRINLAFDGKVTVTVCDRTNPSDDYIIGWKTSKGSIRFYNINLIDLKNLPVSSIDYQSGKVILQELSFIDLIKIFEGSEYSRRKLKYIFNIGIKRDKMGNVKNGKFYLRPAVDTEIEQILFNTNFSGNIDFESGLAKYYPNTRFDLIYGRHFPPIRKIDYVERIPLLRSSISQCLEDPNDLVINYDGRNF